MASIPVRHIRSALSDSSVSSPILVRRLDELMAAQDMVHKLHRHSFYFILVVEKGSGRHSIDFIPYPVAEGDVFIVRPGQVHELSLTKDGKGYVVQFQDDYSMHADNQTRQILKKVSRTNHYRPDQASLGRIHSFMDTMVLEVSQKRSLYQQAIQLILHLLFIEVLRQQGSAPITVDSSITYRQERLEAFQDLIVHHFADQKQVSWYARQLHLSLYQLNALVKAVLDKTGSDLINEYILLEARRYLLATSNQISQISWHLGYEDVSYFIRFFKKHTGQTSEAFRMKFK